MGQQRFVALDGMRGIAALAVLAIHMGGIPARALGGGYLAVDFFFCLSGFVLAHAYGESARGSADFMRLRLIRLYPLYAAGSVLGIVAGLALGARLLSLVGAIGVSALFLPVPFPVVPSQYGSLYPLDPPAWSLFFELIANLAWFALLRRARGLFVWAIVAVAGALLIAIDLTSGGISAGPYWSSLAEGFPRVAYGFLMGTMVYRFWKRSSWRPRLPAFVITLALLAVFTVPLGRNWFDAVTTVLLTPILVFLGACCAEAGPVVSSIQKKSGDASYAVYALHFPVILLMDRLTPAIRVAGWPWLSAHPSLITTPATAVLVVSAALWLDKVYDGPVRRWLLGFGSQAATAIRVGT